MDTQHNKKTAIIQQVTPHKEHLQTLVGWNNFRKKNPQYDLPHSNTLKLHFGSWEDIKSLFDLDNRKKWSLLNQEDALCLIESHIEALKGTPNEWDMYRKTNKLEEELPGSYPLIHIFGSWNQLKQHFGLEVKAPTRPHDYTVEDIRKIIQDYPPHVFTSRAWEKYRKEHKEVPLPSYSTILRYISKEELNLLKKQWYEKNS